MIEVYLAEVSDRDIVTLATRYGRLPPSQRLSEQLTPETAALLEAYLDRRAEALAAHGFTRLVFEAMKPWFAAIPVAAFEMQSAGYAAELGVDRTLLDRAGDIKPVRGLETASAQFAMLEGLSLEVQDLMLRDGLERAEGIQQQAEGLFDAWSRGDADALEQLLFAPLRDDPRLEPFYESVFFARNEAMAAALAEWSMDRRTRLVVLGAGHMVGDRSVPARLAARGFRVSRVRAAPQPDDPSRAKNCSSSLGGPAAMPASIRVFGWL